MEITMGSFFDGIGGFQLAGERNGILTLWASEIEPFPIKVTQLRFPDTVHKGDITKIDGAELEPVGVAVGGSPCQDLSVAGKRAGMKLICPECESEFDITEEMTECPNCGAELDKTRSGLFMEQINRIKEMRAADVSRGRTAKSIRPRYMVWENVPGAFSSNKGEDFRTVLEETGKIADPNIIIPRPPDGKWTTAGCIMGNGWSIAWRVLDAQFWGVPQRRRRIFLVADFGGESAPEVLFKREGLRRHLAESGKAREGTATDAGRGVGKASAGGIGYAKEQAPTLKTVNHAAVAVCNRGSASDKTETLRAESHGALPMVAVAIDSNCQDSRFKLTGQVMPTIPAKAGTGGNNGPMLAIPINDQATHENGGCNGGMVGEAGEPMYSLTARERHIVAGTVSAKWAKGTGGPSGDECQNLVVTQKAFGQYEEGCGPLMAGNAAGKTGENLVVSTLDCRNFVENKELSGTLQSKSNGGQSLNYVNPVVAPTLDASYNSKYGCDQFVKQWGDFMTRYAVRRLTPMECERLQDFPDGWTDIPGASDSARYKALGNSVAVCCPEYVLEGIKEVLLAERR